MGAGGAFEVEVVEADAEQQVDAAADLAQDLRTGFGGPDGRRAGVQERAQLVEVHGAEVARCARRCGTSGAWRAGDNHGSLGRRAPRSPDPATPPCRSWAHRAAGASGSGVRCRRRRRGTDRRGGATATHPPQSSVRSPCRHACRRQPNRALLVVLQLRPLPLERGSGHEPAQAPDQRWTTHQDARGICCVVLACLGHQALTCPPVATRSPMRVALVPPRWV